MAYASANGMSNFEVDFMDFSFLLQSYYQQNVSAAREWLRGMARAAEAYQAPIQYCMPLPRCVTAACINVRH